MDDSPTRSTSTAAAKTPTEPIHLLICEDCEDDAFLIITRLRRDGIELSYERVETAAAAAAALSARPPDLVISDFNMPTFDAVEALALLADSGLDVPFILVSGQIGEEAAVALLRAGAHDFVLKDRLARLAPAVQRELRDAEGRRQRRRAQAALRESEQRFRLFAEHAQDIIFRYRLQPEPEVEYLSPATTPILGHRPEQLCGNPQRLFSLVEPADRSILEASWRSPAPEPLAVRWRRSDGATVWTEQRAVGLRDDGRLIAVEGILRDVTGQVTAQREREQLERQLRQAERLEAVGQLAGGVAHDFNNLLCVILGNVDLAITDLPSDHPIQEELAGIERAAERGAALTRQLLIFSRSEPTQLETLDLNAVVGDTERLLRRTIGEDLDFCTQLAPELPAIRMDRARLEQILVNLVVNSRAAMPDGGRLTIETAVEPDLPGGVGAGGHGRRVLLRVIDTGCGMSPEVARRAFEPFFTTKGPGEGTGLGLSTVYGAVKEAGGEIGIVSRPGAGTTVQVLLPGVDTAPAPAGSVPEADAAAPPRGGDETILVVEDEAPLRELIERTLTRAGYRVVSAASAADAIRLVETEYLRFDVLLTDVVMPGQSGCQLAELFRLDRPELPVLLMSGYTAGALPGGTELPADTPLIRKPFTGPDLLARLREVLNGSRAIPR